jgi:hypothetical protein
MPAGNRPIDLYLDSGRVDASRYVPQKIDFTRPAGRPPSARRSPA